MTIAHNAALAIAGPDVEQSAMDELRHMFKRDVNNLALVGNFNNIFSISGGSGHDFIYCPAIANAQTLAASNYDIPNDKQKYLQRHIIWSCGG